MSAPAGSLHHGDCLELVPELARRGKFDLAYADPPFNAGGKRAARVGKGERVRGQHAYDDAWSSIEAFLRMLEPRLEVLRDALSARGTLWLHLDHRTVHDAKVAADRVF
ncbi:MAG TPA: DNA methyltransferase, partial [Polyangiaceae bacterium]|nr:DNA methyltransferase [Polyangiaceae bacterium]